MSTPLIKRSMVSGSRSTTTMFGVSLTIVGLATLAALVIAIIALVLRGNQIEDLNGSLGALAGETVNLIQDVATLENATQTLNDQIVNQTAVLSNLVETLTQVPPIYGWLAFWWVQDGRRNEWARFNESTGAMIGNTVPYSPAEARQSAAPGKAQYSPGPNLGDMAYLVWADFSLQHYLVRHNTLLGTFNKTDLGANPTNHQSPEVVHYDPLNARYIGMATITTQSYKYGVVVIDENTGAVTPLTGEFGSLPPLPTNQGLDMDVIGNRILFYDRYDDVPTNWGHILFYNSSDGQYLSESFWNGTLIPYPGTFLPTFLTYNVQRFWYIAAGYDPATFRLHLVIATVSGGFDRAFGWVEGSSEADLLAKLESGNYDIHITQFMPAFQINAAAFIPPPGSKR